MFLATSFRACSRSYLRVLNKRLESHRNVHKIKTKADPLQIQKYFSPLTAKWPIEIKFIDEKRGKGVFAKTDIKKNDLVFEEKPVTSSPFPINKVLCRSGSIPNSSLLIFAINTKPYVISCSNCMKFIRHRETSPLFTLPDLNKLDPKLLGTENTKATNTTTKLQCEDDHYCSDQCHDTHRKNYHNFICKSTHKDNSALMELYREFNMIKDVWGEKFPVMAMELIVKLIFEQARYVIDQEKHDQDVYTKLGYFAFQPDLGFDEGHLGLFEELSRIIGNIIELVAGKHIADSIDTSAECIKRMASIIITNQQNIIINSTNALDIYVNNLKANPNQETHTLGFKLLNEFDELFMAQGRDVLTMWCPDGSGLFTLHSCLNHSCTPNARIDNNRDSYYLQVFAIRDIVKGEEVFSSYVEVDATQEERQKRLNQYGFQCNCSRCQMERKNK